MLDVVSLGDVMIDHFFFVHDARVRCERTDHICRMELPYGTKIPVDLYRHAIGGNCANVAVGTTRLGLKSALITIVGNDSSGQEVVRTMKHEGVTTRWMSVDKKEETSTSAVLSVHGERTILVHHVPRDYRKLNIPNAKAYYLTSAGPRAASLSILHNRVLSTLKQRPHALLGFNPGTYQFELGLQKLNPVLKRTDILFLNKEESRQLLSMPNAPIEELLRAWRGRGIPSVVITDGQLGAWAANAQGAWHQDIFSAKVVERTGAGDSFACGVLSATLKGKKLPEALAWGAANASSVVSSIGPQTGLLSAQKMSLTLKRFKKIEAKKIE